MRVRTWMIVALLLTVVGSIAADPPDAPHPLLRRWWLYTPVCPSVGCCDDYHCKPMPSICPIPHCGCADDYQCKPMPCVPPLLRCGNPDDYCRKPIPCQLCPPVFPCDKR